MTIKITIIFFVKCTHLSSLHTYPLQHFPHRGFPLETANEDSVTGLEHFWKIITNRLDCILQYNNITNHFTYPAFEAFGVPFLFKSNDTLRFDRFAASTASGSEQFRMALVAVRVSILLHERLVSERLLALLAHKVLFVPMDVQSLDDVLPKQTKNPLEYLFKSNEF